MKINKKTIVMISFFVISSMMFGMFQNFVYKNKGVSYLYDGFEVENASRKIWTLTGASCNQVPHLKDGKYPTLGQTTRPGECVFREDKNTGNHFLRFITHPFDRRDAAYRGGTPYENSVDHGKGGAEIRANDASLYNDKSKSGWDLSGEQYLQSGNKVRYSFDFRIYNLSIIETREDGTRKDKYGNNIKYKLANSSTITQFHSKQNTKDKLGNLKSCGNYYPGSAPSPGLDISETKGDTTAVDFKLFIKVFKEDIPKGFVARTCSTQLPVGSTDSALKRDLCQVEVWSKSYKKTDVLKKWFSASILINSDIKKGSLEFFFGSKESSAQPEVLYNRVAFSHKKGIIAPLATQHNSCPSTIYLGNYVLGYEQEMYGYYKNSFIKLEENASNELIRKACNDKPEPFGRYDRHRACQGDSFVHKNFINEFGKFIDGSFYSTETPPMLIVDYDNFRIIQH